MIVTIFKNIFAKEPYFVKIDKVLERIKSGNSRELVNKIRNSYLKEERLELKKQLPSICFSGQFSKRANDSCNTHSGLVCLDFDHLPDVQKFKDELIKDKYVYSAFVSPSGDGLKVLIKIPAKVETHKASCKALKEYFKTQNLDSFEDVARVCFESYDSDIFINKDSETFTNLVIDEVKTHQVLTRNTNALDIFNKLKTWIEKSDFYSDGNKHNFLVKFAGALNRFGVNQYEALNLLISTYKYLASEVKEKDFERIVSNVYRNYSNQFNSEYFEISTGISYNRVTRVQTDEKFFNEYNLQDENEVLLNRLKECLIDTDTNITKPPVLLSIKNEFDNKLISIATSGNISVIKGKAKSKKTYLLKMFAASLAKNEPIFNSIIPSLPANKRNIIVIDTEQSRYDTKRTAWQINHLGQNNDFITLFNFRGIVPDEINKLLRFIVEKFENIGVIFIDQVADFVKSLNSEEEAIKVVKILEKFGAEKDIHVCCIVHINKLNDFAQGWLGTQLMKKAETIINVSRDEKNKRLGIVEPDLTRGEEFEPFVFAINDDGLPYMCDRMLYDELKKTNDI